MTQQEKKIRFHNAIRWQFKPMVQQLEKAGYKYGLDMQGYNNQLGDYLKFQNKNAYEKALKIKKHLDALKEK